MRFLTAAFAAAASIACAEPVDFKLKEAKGDTLVVTEEQRIDGKLKYEAVRGKSKADFGKRKTEFLDDKKWQYDQTTKEVAEDKTVWEREFAVATKEELSEDGKEKKLHQFPHHGRTVKVVKAPEGLAIFAEGEQLEGDKNEQGWMDVLPLLLPKDPLAEGKDYEIDGGAVFRAWSHGIWTDKTSSGTGKGKFQERVKVGKANCAKLWVSMTAKGEATKDLPGAEMALQGFVTFSIDDGKVLKLELAGPVTYHMLVKNSPDVGDVNVTVSGTLKETLTADIFGK